MTYIEAIKSVFKNSFNFKGRARRKEFWYFILSSLLIDVFLLYTIISQMVSSKKIEDCVILFVFLLILKKLLFLIPTLSVSVRRLHDVNMTGWFLLFFCFLSIFGFIVFALYACSDSYPDTNTWGANPKLENEGTDNIECR